MVFLFFIISFCVAIFLFPIVKKIAIKNKIIDLPSRSKRKIHNQPMPLLGGFIIFISFFAVLLLAINFNVLQPESFKIKHLIALFLAGLILMVGGFLDDKYNLRPIYQIIWPIIAILVFIISGVGIEYINNPFGPGYLYLDKYKIEVINLNGIPYYFTPLADIITFVWLILLMYSTKLLDGLDGLVSGISLIGLLGIIGLCFFTKFYQPDIGLIAVILSGAFAGFLIFNFHPAKIFLGEGGSLFAGFILGALAIISGSKIATTFLILGLAVFDLLGVFFQRIFKYHKSPFSGDKIHLHFRLLDIGFSHKQAVFFYWLIALFFTLPVLFFQTKGKIITLVIFSFFYLFLILFLNKKIIKLTNKQ